MGNIKCLKGQVDLQQIGKMDGISISEKSPDVGLGGLGFHVKVGYKYLISEMFVEFYLRYKKKKGFDSYESFF